MKTIYKAILRNLELSRDRILQLDPRDRGEVILEETMKVVGLMEGQVALNIAPIMIEFIAGHQYNVDAMIDYLKVAIYRTSNFDEETMVRELKDGFDKKYGTETSLILDQIELSDVITPERMLFSARLHPSPVEIVKSALEHVSRLLGDELNSWRLIDVGSGLGRNLLLATQYPFREIIGIEISAYLCRKTSENIQRYCEITTPVCRPVVVNADALTFEIPDGKTVFYFWEPFERNLQKKFIAKLDDFVAKGNELILIFLGRPFQDLSAFSFAGKVSELGAVEEFYKLTFFSSSPARFMIAKYNG